MNVNGPLSSIGQCLWNIVVIYRRALDERALLGVGDGGGGAAVATFFFRFVFGGLFSSSKSSSDEAVLQKNQRR